MPAPTKQSDRSNINQNARFPWLATLIALVAVVIMLRLGYWQIQRANAKQDRLQQIEQRSGLDALTIDDVLSMDQDVSDFILQATGELDVEHYFLLDNRIVNQQVGYEVLVPFRTGRYLLLVNLGWIRAPQSRDLLPSVVLPGNELVIYGMLSQPTKNPFVSEVTSGLGQWPNRVQEIDLVQLSGKLDGELLPFVLQLSPEHELGYERHWKPVIMSPQKHWAYAIQWFGLALACIIIAVIAIRKKIQRGRFKDE
jgi:cytochrome oxidase assembly protein ShyY1